MKTILTATAVSIFMATALPTSSEIIRFDMSGLSGETFDPWFEGSLHENVDMVRQLTRNGLFAAGRTGEFSSSGWNASDFFNPWDQYLSFAVQGKEDFQLKLSEFRFNQSGSLSGPGTIRVQMSADGFATVLLEKDFTGTTSLTTHQMDLDELRIPPLTQLEIRLYAFGSVSLSGGDSSQFGAVRFSDTILSGFALNVVPQPVQLTIARGREVVFSGESGRTYRVQLSEDGETWQDHDVVAATGDEEQRVRISASAARGKSTRVVRAN